MRVPPASAVDARRAWSCGGRAPTRPRPRRPRPSASGERALSSELLPTPLWPTKTTVRPAIARAAPSDPSPVLAEQKTSGSVESRGRGRALASSGSSPAARVDEVDLVDHHRRRHVAVRERHQEAIDQPGARAAAGAARRRRPRDRGWRPARARDGRETDRAATAGWCAAGRCATTSSPEVGARRARGRRPRSRSAPSRASAFGRWAETIVPSASSTSHGPRAMPTTVTGPPAARRRIRVAAASIRRALDPIRAPPRRGPSAGRSASGAAARRRASRRPSARGSTGPRGVSSRLDGSLPPAPASRGFARRCRSAADAVLRHAPDRAVVRIADRAHSSLALVRPVFRA